MQETSTTLAVEVDPRSNITDLVVRNAHTRPDRAVYARLVAGSWHDVTAAEFLCEVTDVAKGLVARGVQPGERVGLMSRTRYEWTLLDAAIWFAGAVTVPIYETSSADQLQWIVSDSGTGVIVVESRTHAALAAKTFGADDLSVWVLDEGAVADLVAAGRDVDDQEIERRRRLAGLDDLATIIYTSGTTGRPKGCELTHGNFVVLAENATARLGDVVAVNDSSTLMFMPLAHVFARFIEVLCMCCAAKVAHCSDPDALTQQLGQVQPTFFLSVPRMFEKIYNTAEQRAIASGKGKLFAQATQTAIEYSKALDTGHIDFALRARHSLFNRIVYPKLRDVFGGRARYVVSGGAPLGERLGHFYRGIGIIVLEGYGLTETTAPTTVNLPASTKIGTVGPPLPGVSVRIADSGEVLVKGPHVFRGYRNNPEATAESFVDGWFATGDLGSLDIDGFLRITGRSKELLVTAGGKNVAPEVLEDRLRAHPLVSQCMVVGDGKPFIAALITLDPDMLATWAAAEGRTGLDLATAVHDPGVRAALQAAVDDANQAVSRAESIRRFDVLDTDFTIASGHLTPSLKLKRSIVMADYADAVERLYS